MFYWKACEGKSAAEIAEAINEAQFLSNSFGMSLNQLAHFGPLFEPNFLLHKSRGNETLLTKRSLWTYFGSGSFVIMG